MSEVGAAARSKAPSEDYVRAQQAANHVYGRTGLRPRVALVLGSGLGGFAEHLTEAIALRYQDIPYFPRPTAEGHAGRMIIGNCDGVPLAVMQGRAHLYEGHPLRDVVFPMRVFGAMGVKAVVLTNAAGGIRPDYSAGCLVTLRDHINLQGVNPLLGPNDDRLGPRFVDLTEAYYRPYRELALRAGQRLGIAVHEGVYAAMSGPTYETPAEICFLRTIGADLVGMSTVPEVITARHIGLKVLAISCVTNMAAGLAGHPLSHEEVLATGERVKEQFMALLQAVLPGVAEDVVDKQ
jgi:purine-nucleoside phosphorylase